MSRAVGFEVHALHAYLLCICSGCISGCYMFYMLTCPTCLHGLHDYMFYIACSSRRCLAALLYVVLAGTELVAMMAGTQ